MSDLTDDRLAEMISQTDHAGMWEVVRALLELQRHLRDVAELFEDGRKPGSGQSRPRAKATQEGTATSSQGATAQGAARSAGNVAEPQIGPTPDRTDHPPSSPISERIGAAPKCHQDPSIDAAWCAVHDECPDWSSDVAGYRGPAGWVCNSGGMVFDQLISDAAKRGHDAAAAHDVDSQRDAAPTAVTTERTPGYEPCRECRYWLGVVTEACAAHSGHELLTAALRDVISIMDGIGGYLTPDDQHRLRHARQLAGMTP